VQRSHGDHSYDLPLSAFTRTLAGSSGLEYFSGNPGQQAVFQLMIQACNKAHLTGNQELSVRARESNDVP